MATNSTSLYRIQRTSAKRHSLIRRNQECLLRKIPPWWRSLTLKLATRTLSPLYHSLNLSISPSQFTSRRYLDYRPKVNLGLMQNQDKFSQQQRAWDLPPLGLWQNHSSPSTNLTTISSTINALTSTGTVLLSTAWSRIQKWTTKSEQCSVPSTRSFVKLISIFLCLLHLGT